MYTFLCLWLPANRSFLDTIRLRKEPVQRSVPPGNLSAPSWICSWVLCKQTHLSPGVATPQRVLSPLVIAHFLVLLSLPLSLCSASMCSKEMILLALRLEHAAPVLNSVLWFSISLSIKVMVCTQRGRIAAYSDHDRCLHPRFLSPLLPLHQPPHSSLSLVRQGSAPEHLTLDSLSSWGLLSHLCHIFIPGSPGSRSHPIDFCDRITASPPMSCFIFPLCFRNHCYANIPVLHIFLSSNIL